MVIIVCRFSELSRAQENEETKKKKKIQFSEGNEVSKHIWFTMGNVKKIL